MQNEITVPISTDRERLKNVILFAIGEVSALKAEGLVEGGPNLTEEGARQYNHLVASGFSITPAEREWALRGLVAPTGL